MSKRVTVTPPCRTIWYQPLTQQALVVIGDILAGTIFIDFLVALKFFNAKLFMRLCVFWIKLTAELFLGLLCRSLASADIHFRLTGEYFEYFYWKNKENHCTDLRRTRT